MAQKAKRKKRPAPFIRRRPDEPGGTYYIDYSSGGRRIRESLETDVLTIAKERRDRLIGGEIEAKWSQSTRDPAPRDFWKEYEAWAALHKSKQSLDRERITWAQFREFLKPQTLGSVTAHGVERFKRHLKEERKQSNRTINDSCVRMQALYNRAAKLGIYGKTNPFVGFTRLPTERAPLKFLDLLQIDEMLKAAETHSADIHLFIAMGIYAGLRTGEIVNTRWEWFDFEQGTLTVQKAEDGSFGTKGKRYRSIPLHDKLRAILEPQRRDEGYIINGDKTKPGKWRIRYEPKRAFGSVAKVAGVEWCTPHTLRHTFASQLVQAGISLYKVSRWLGHADITTTQIYAHLAPVDEDINAF